MDVNYNLSEVGCDHHASRINPDSVEIINNSQAYLIISLYFSLDYNHVVQELYPLDYPLFWNLTVFI